MALDRLKIMMRQFAKVEATVVSQEDDYPDTGDLSDETLALRDALRTYSKVRPLVSVVDVLANGDYEFPLATIITGFHPDTHQITRVWWPTAMQQDFQVQGSDVRVYQKSGGSWWMKLLYSIPTTGSISVEYSHPHIVDATTDTLSASAPSDVEAVCHLAAANVLQMAANYFAKQHSTNLSADVSNTQQQSVNYAMRAKDETRKFTDYIGSRKVRSSSRANWGQARADDVDLFWPRRGDRRGRI